jgi:hypothetical protein
MINLQKTFLLFFLVLLVGTRGYTQESYLKVGEWKSLLPLSSGTSVTQSDNQVIYASNNVLMIIDKWDGSIKTLSKSDGLSDVSILHVKYHRPTASLIVVYQNSNIDIIRDGNILNFSQIRNNQNISGDKTIYNLSFGDANNVFFSCGFGLVEFFLDNLVFGSTVITPLRVNDFATLAGVYFMATQEGLYRADPRAIPLIADFSLWNLIESGLTPGIEVSQVEAHGGQLYAGQGNTIYKTSDGLDFQHYFQLNGYDLLFLSGETTLFSAGFRCLQSSCRPRILFFENDDIKIEADASCVDSPRFAIEDQTGRVWFADNFRTFKTAPSAALACERREYNSPFSSNVSDIELDRGRLYIASGGTQPNFDYLFREDGFFMLEQGLWYNYNKFTVPEINSLDIRDFYKIKAHPKEDKVYIGSYISGLIEWKSRDDFKLYDKDNSSLGGTVGDIQRTRVSGLEFDAKDNLWISNFLAQRPFSVLTKEGEWRSFEVSGSTELGDIAIDAFNNKWFVVYRGGLLVFNEGSDLNNTAGYQMRRINTTNSLLPSNNVNCVVTDLDGAVWVGTDQGVLVFECGQRVFEASCRGTDRRLEQDGYGAILLSTENIRKIAVDGGNRKWIGTTNGLFVQSADGDVGVYNFNTDNSPLLDNTIIDLEIDPKTGEVYIATNRGVQVFRSDATQGRAVFEDEVYTFPNPVRPGYEGPIAIKGLARDANFKITDVEGRLVFEGRAAGGQAIWDGRDLSGRKVGHGVYLVFATYTKNLEFPVAHVTKILVMH